MSHFFCAEASRESGEEIIGSAPSHHTYILIECPTPWAEKALESKEIPQNLRELAAKLKKAQQSVRFILIYAKDRVEGNKKRVIVCHKKEGYSDGYSKRKFVVEDLADVAPKLEKYLAGDRDEIEWVESLTQDILVCTHGSHDKCCARYGYPFYRQACDLAARLEMKNVRIWEASHIGGHRFAPTLLSLPEGRYYGALDADTFGDILQRTGNIDCLRRVYRGWGLFPLHVQVLERELMLQQGWDWFKFKIDYKILSEKSDRSFTRVELHCQKPNGDVLVYQGDIVPDESKTLVLRGSCNSDSAASYVKYGVENLSLVGDLARLSAVG
ncbi:MAG: sucrase ferredoxin [Cyanobacteriota bacterium]|nr:sucrase ferredoxin [Cyanobacteriota bacterium]